MDKSNRIILVKNMEIVSPYFQIAVSEINNLFIKFEIQIAQVF